MSNEGFFFLYVNLEYETMTQLSDAGAHKNKLHVRVCRSHNSLTFKTQLVIFKTSSLIIFLE
jgi:hypothetical protein